MIDFHVHLRDWNQKQKETVEHGLAVAKLCGINAVADMPNCDPPLTDRETVLDRLALAAPSVKRHKVSYHVYIGLTKDPDQIRGAVNTYNELYPLVIGLKMFAGHSTGNMGITEPEDQRTVFRTLAEMNYSGVLALHCEKESLMRSDLYVQGQYETQSLARPAEAEIESIKDMIALAEETGYKGRLHICHISTREGIEEVVRAKEKGMKITCAATAHHALLTSKDACDHSRYLRMNPPLRDEENRRAVYEGLINGKIDYVESDHAPHTIEDKKKGMGGIPGFAGDLILLRALKKDNVPQQRLEELFALNCAHDFGIEAEGRIIPDRIDWRIEQAVREYPYNGFV